MRPPLDSDYHNQSHNKAAQRLQQIDGFSRRDIFDKVEAPLSTKLSFKSLSSSRTHI
jgi:hypothetical protein